MSGGATDQGRNQTNTNPSSPYTPGPQEVTVGGIFVENSDDEVEVEDEDEDMDAWGKATARQTPSNRHWFQK